MTRLIALLIADPLQCNFKKKFSDILANWWYFIQFGIVDIPNSYVCVMGFYLSYSPKIWLYVWFSHQLCITIFYFSERDPAIIVFVTVTDLSQDDDNAGFWSKLLCRLSYTLASWRINQALRWQVDGRASMLTEPCVVAKCWLDHT